LAFARFGERGAGELIVGRFGEDDDDGDAGVVGRRCVGREMESRERTLMRVLAKE
jgi:hypothetical protein